MRILRYTYPNSELSPSALGAFRSSVLTGLDDFEQLSASLLDAVSNASAYHFPVDTFEDQDNHYIRAELPGVSRSDVDVELAGRTLVITAKQKQGTTSEAPESVYRRELVVPLAIQADAITAAHVDGVLTVTLPKKAEAKPRKIIVSENN